MQNDGELGAADPGSMLGLYLKQCRLTGCEPASTLLRAFHNKYSSEVHHLDFSGIIPQSNTPLGDILSVILAADLDLVESCDLSNNELRSEDIPAICNACRMMPRLVSIDLSRNPKVAYAGSKYILDLVKKHTSLLSLNTDETGLVHTTKNLITQCLRQNAAKLPPIGMGRGDARPSSMSVERADQIAAAAEEDEVLPKRPAPPAAKRPTPANRSIRADQAGGMEPTGRHIASPPMFNPGSAEGNPRSKRLAASPEPSEPDVFGMTERRRKLHSEPHPDAAPLELNPELLPKHTDAIEEEKKAFVDLQDIMSRQHPDIEAMNAAQRHDLRAKHQKALNLGFNYVTACEHILPSSYSVSDLLGDCITDGTDPLSEIEGSEKLPKVYNIQSPIPQIAIHRTLKNIRLAPKLQDPGTGEMKPNVASDREQLAEVLPPYDLEYHMDCVDPLLERLHHPILDIAFLKEEIRESDPKVKKMEFEIDACIRNRDNSVDDEDTAAAEKYHDRAIALGEDLLEEYQKRIQCLESQGRQKEFLGNLDDYFEKLMARNAAERAKHAALIERLGGLERTLAFKREKEDLRHDQCLFDFNQFRKCLVEDLDVNQRRQNKCWESVTNSLAELTRLGKERNEMGERLIDEGEKEGQRLSDYKQFVSVFENYSAGIDALKSQAEGFNHVIDDFNDFAGLIRDEVKDKAGRVGNWARSILRDEYRDYYKHFSKTYKNTGDLMFVKEKRLEELDRVARSNNFQIESSKETFDPQITKHKNRAAKLEVMRETTLRKIENLRLRADKSAEDFSRIQDILDAESPKEFPDPTVKLQENLVERRTLALGKLQSFQGVEIDGVEEERHNIDEMTRTTAEAKEMHLRTLVSPQRAAVANSKFMPATSPTRTSSPTKSILATSPGAGYTGEFPSPPSTWRSTQQG